MSRTSTSRALGSSERPIDAAARAPEVLIVEDNSELRAVGLMNVLEDWEMKNVQGRCKAHIATNIDRALVFLRDDKIDIYIVDLILDEAQPDRKIGAEFDQQYPCPDEGRIVRF